MTHISQPRDPAQDQPVRDAAGPHVAFAGVGPVLLERLTPLITAGR